MSEEQRMKALLIRDKEFLKSIFVSNSVSQTKNILKNASDSKLNTLVKCLHMISNGFIKVQWLLLFYNIFISLIMAITHIYIQTKFVLSKTAQE